MSKAYYSSFFSLIFILFTSSFISAQTPGAYKALDLDGTDDYVLISDNTSLNSDTTIAVEAWIKADGYGSNSYDNSIFCKHGWSRGNKGYVLRCGDNGRLSFNFSDASGAWKEAESARIMKAGVWYHVAGTFDGDSINIYINGELVETTLYSGKIETSTGLTARIGDLANGGGRRFDGVIDEVRVWSTDIDQSTLKDWMCRKVNSAHPNFSNLAGYWKLDKDTGVIATDASSKGNHGTLTNGPTRVLSGAALGEFSAYTYSAANVSLKTKFKDEMLITNIKGTPDYFHVFSDYSKSDQGLAKGQGGNMDTTHYFGVFYPDDTAVKYDVSYDFGSVTGLSANDKCAMSLYTKTSGYTGTWSNSGAIFHASGDSLSLSGQTKQEYVVVFQETDSNKIVSSNTGKFYLCGTDKLTLLASGNDSFTYAWYMNGAVLTSQTSKQLVVDSVAKYKVVITRKGSTCSFTSSTIDVKRSSKPTVTLSAFKDVCEDQDTLILRGASPQGGVFSGLDVVDSFFFPSKLKQGSYTIEYAFMDTNFCSSSASQTIQVNGLPTLSKTGTFAYCSNMDTVALREITPMGGTYAGQFYSNNTLHIDSAGYAQGFYPFVYSYTDGNGCSNILSDSIEVKWATPITMSVVPTSCLNDDDVVLTGSPSSGTFTGKGVYGNLFTPKTAGVGKHQIIYAFTNALNCVSRDTQVAEVINNSTVTWTEKVDKCLNSDSIQLSEGSPNGGYFTGNGMTTTGRFDPAQAGTGSHTLGYVSVDGNGCHNKAEITAVVHDTTLITFTAATPVCLLSDALAMNVALPTGGTYNGAGITNDTLHPGLAGFGIHDVMYEYTDGNGCTSIGGSTFEIFKPDSISITTDQLLCSYDDPVVLQLYPTGGKLEGKGIIGSVFSPALSGSGMHLVRYSLTDQQGCPNRDSIEIVVVDAPNVEFPPIARKCLNDEVFTLNTATPLDSGVYSVNETETDQFDPMTLGVGWHEVKYRVENYAGCTDSAEIEVRVNALPPKPTISTVKNTLVSSANKGSQWIDTDGPIAGATNKIYDATQDNIYWVEVTNDSGCVARSDSFDFMYVGIAQILPSWIKVFPNPSISGQYQLEGIGQSATLHIKDLQGREIEHKSTSNRLIDLSSMADGVYLLSITEHGQTYPVRLIKGH